MTTAVAKPSNVFAAKLLLLAVVVALEILDLSAECLFLIGESKIHLIYLSVNLYILVKKCTYCQGQHQLAKLGLIWYYFVTSIG